MSFFILFSSFIFIGSASAQGFEKANIIREPVSLPRTIEQKMPLTEKIPKISPVVSEEVECTYAEKAKPVFSGRFVSLKKDLGIQPGEVFQVKVLIQNTGNVPWFSRDSGCKNVPTVNLGTAYEKDRFSPFFVPSGTKTGWISPNRIKMDTRRVDPSGIASFTFSAKAPEVAGFYREFYAPVVEARTWIEGAALFSIDIPVGTFDPISSPYLPFILKSGNLSTLDFNGEKSIRVSLSKQTMWVKVGETVVKTFPVSTGTYKTPTPPGNFQILSKQKVRIASKKPHYIMPLFMMFKNGGYGIHALPSLANDRGVFWREALNHIGTRRSHGCIRLLPDDAQFVWDFSDVGTKMVVKY